MTCFALLCSVVEGVASLQAHVERLFLLVLLHQLPAGGTGGTSSGGGGGVVGAQSVALLAALFSLGWAVSTVGGSRGCACLPAGHSTPSQHPRTPTRRTAACPQPARLLQVRRLAVALARTFHGPRSRQAAAVEAGLGGEERWAAHEQLLDAAQAAMGLAA